MVETLNRSVVAAYRNHNDAEDAVRRIERAGIPLRNVSIIGRDYQVREDIQGYYRPSDAAREGAGFGAWVGGIFGMLMGFGYFLVPVVGPVLALGPIAGLVAGAIGGAGIGAIVNGLMALGIPRDEALKYQARIQAGEFLVVVQGSEDLANRARETLQVSDHVGLDTHDAAQTQEPAMAGR